MPSLFHNLNIPTSKHLFIQSHFAPLSASLQSLKRDGNVTRRHSLHADVWTLNWMTCSIAFELEAFSARAPRQGREACHLSQSPKTGCHRLLRVSRVL